MGPGVPPTGPGVTITGAIATGDVTGPIDFVIYGRAEIRHYKTDQ
jgi:hypothetical protein